MKHEDVKHKSREELEGMLKEYREKLRSLQFNLKLGKVQDTTAIQKAKRMIARIVTMMHYGQTT